jgi:hypothetical protein
VGRSGGGGFAWVDGGGGGGALVQSSLQVGLAVVGGGVGVHLGGTEEVRCGWALGEWGWVPFSLFVLCSNRAIFSLRGTMSRP